MLNPVVGARVQFSDAYLKAVGKSLAKYDPPKAEWRGTITKAAPNDPYVKIEWDHGEIVDAGTAIENLYHIMVLVTVKEP